MERPPDLQASRRTPRHLVLGDKKLEAPWRSGNAQRWQLPVYVGSIPTGASKLYGDVVE